jgi:hypothetical protein
MRCEEEEVLELSPTGTYVHNRSPKFPPGRVSQQVGSAYLRTFLRYVDSSDLQ